MLNRCGGRKFLLTAMSLPLFASLLVGDYLGEATFATLVLGTVGAYIASNVVQKKVGGGGAQ